MNELQEKLNEIKTEKDTKIIPGNIKKDVQIFDVTGTYEGSGIDTSDATATSSDIRYSKTAYADGEKITGAILVPIEESTTVNDYVSSGKILHLDAICNGGSEVHTESSNQWYDHVSETFKVDLSATRTWGADYISCNNDIQFIINNFSGFASVNAITLHMKLNHLKTNVDNIFLSSANFPEGYWNGGIAIGNMSSGLIVAGPKTDFVQNISLSDISNTDEDVTLDVVVQLNTSVKVYINGILKTTVSRCPANILPQTTRDYYIGRLNQDKQTHLNCNLKEYILYNRALTDEEIETNYTVSMNRNPNIFGSAYASSSDILEDKNAYDVNGVLIVGGMSNNGDVTITPTTEQQTKESGYYNSLAVEAVTSAIDENIKPENIKEGITILGVTGTYTGEVTE